MIFFQYSNWYLHNKNSNNTHKKRRNLIISSVIVSHSKDLIKLQFHIQSDLIKLQLHTESEGFEKTTTVSYPTGFDKTTVSHSIDLMTLPVSLQGGL